ncbi:hypothetical protein [Acinetobacter sp. SAAs470]|uniref:hypothetical protein n=1 Tax=unclassified Acinetobacter TaxID=196816 RepID=UPI0039778205
MNNSSNILDSQNTPITAVNRRKNKPQASLIHYRMMIFYRFALALIGGYILATLSAILIAHYFADYRGSAAMSATLIALTLWAGAFIWVFMVHQTLKASLGIIIPSTVLYLMYQLVGI